MDNKKIPKSVDEISLEKSFQTCFIGILELIENVFGHLWGHQIKFYEKTEQQKEYFAKWKVLRELILNHGNKILRKTINQLEKGKDNGNG